MTSRILSYGKMAGFILTLCVAVAIPLWASAVPVDCPAINDTSRLGLGFVRRCRVTDGDAEFLVLARGDPDGALATLFFDAAVFHFTEAFAIFDLDSGIAPDSVLVSATVDTDTGSIEVVLDLLDVVLDKTVVATVTATFQLDGSSVTESVEIRSTVSATFTGLLYALTDFDLNGTSLDDTAMGDIGGITITDGDGLTTATFAATGGSQPDAFEVAVFPVLTNIVQGEEALGLLNTVASGPDDLEAAFFWQNTFNSIGDTFSTTVTKTVPEPGAGLLHAASLAALAGLASRRRGRQAAATRHNAGGMVTRRPGPTLHTSDGAASQLELAGKEPQSLPSPESANRNHPG